MVMIKGNAPDYFKFNPWRMRGADLQVGCPLGRVLQDPPFALEYKQAESQNGYALRAPRPTPLHFSARNSRRDTH
jgi:hypothetical protein